MYYLVGVHVYMYYDIDLFFHFKENKHQVLVVDTGYNVFMNCPMFSVLSLYVAQKGLH